MLKRFCPISWSKGPTENLVSLHGLLYCGRNGSASTIPLMGCVPANPFLDGWILRYEMSLMPFVVHRIVPNSGFDLDSYGLIVFGVEP
jgi:hypothetical protein